MNRRVYASKVDTWLVLVVVGVGLALAAGAAWQIAAMGMNHLGSWILVLSLLFYVGVVFGFAYPAAYEIRPPHLIVRAGCTRSRISLSTIVSVEPTREATSAPALSVVRLRIAYKEAGRSASKLISPRDQSGFLAELAQATGSMDSRTNRVMGSDEDRVDAGGGTGTHTTSDSSQRAAKGLWVGNSIWIGAAVGVALGVLVDQLVWGLLAGAVLGMLVGSILVVACRQPGCLHSLHPGSGLVL